MAKRNPTIEEWRAATLAAVERPPVSRLDLFAAEISRHDASTNPPKRGGNVTLAARRIGLADVSGNGMLQRLRRDLGWQAQ